MRGKKKPNQTGHIVRAREVGIAEKGTERTVSSKNKVVVTNGGGGAWRKNGHLGGGMSVNCYSLGDNTVEEVRGQKLALPLRCIISTGERKLKEPGG